MADYHPLIARAVAGLENNTGENRRALYERARTALVTQLRSVTPALEESEITRERLALEEAIRRIENEAARAGREPPPRPAPPPAPPPPRRPPERAQERSSEPPPPRSAEAPPSRSTEAPSLSDTAMRGYRDGPNGQTTAPPRPVRPERRPPPPPPPRGGAAPFEAQPYAEAPLASPAPRPPRPAPVDLPPEPSYADDEPSRTFRRPRGPLIRNAAILLLVVAAAAVAYWQRGSIAGAGRSLTAWIGGSGTPTTPEAPSTTTPTRPKITDRLGQPGTATNPAPEAPVAQRVVLYEEDPEDPQGKRLVGTAVWRVEQIAPAPGRAADFAVRADVDIPERQMKMTFSLRRNADASLPASHTIEIVFSLPNDAPSGGVQNVPGVLMKQAEQTRGVPLAGLAVKVTPGFFLIGLSSQETDMQRNIQLLKERAWFDVPIVYNNNRRAILAMEKGTPGERAFLEAFQRWGQ